MCVKCGINSCGCNGKATYAPVTGPSGIANEITEKISILINKEV